MRPIYLFAIKLTLSSEFYFISIANLASKWKDTASNRVVNKEAPSFERAFTLRSSYLIYDNEVSWTKYNLDNNRRFNLPIYYVGSTLYNSQGNPYMGHGMNVIITGDNALNFNDWNFIEPQNDNKNVVPGETSSITVPGYVTIYAPNHFGEDLSNPDMLRGDRMIIFEIDTLGNIYPLNYSKHPDLVTERPQQLLKLIMLFK